MATLRTTAILACAVFCPLPGMCYQSLHMIDLQKVMCPGEPGYFDVELDSTQLSGSAASSPHIVTFLRSSNKATNISFQLLQTDGTGASSATGVGETISLTYLSARRLEESQARQLSGRRRGGGFSSARRRPSPSPPPRTPSPPPYAVSPRRRSMNTNSPSARRRGTDTMSTGVRRRTTATTAPNAPATHNRFQTSGGSGYGYGSQGTMQNNYGGSYPAASPGYGYAGTSAYGPSRTSSVAPIAAGFVGGMVVGAGTYYLLSSMRRSYCDGYSCCYGCSDSCYSGGRDNCNMRVDRDLYRDDILQSGQGFYPSDFMAPMKIRITAVTGSGYEVSSICPPSDWDPAAEANATTVPNDLFVTLTQMTELADPEDGPDGFMGVSGARCQHLGSLAALPLCAAMAASPLVG